MLASPYAALSLYFSSALLLTAAVQVRTEWDDPVRPIERARARGEVEPGIPRLDPDDPMANREVLTAALADVGYPGLESNHPVVCTAAPRRFSVLLGGRLSHVRIGGRAVCQLERLKAISIAQPGLGASGVAELAAFVLGRRGDGNRVDVTRIVVPPFRFTGETITFVAADLGPLEHGEALVGTYHTHPEDDAQQGVLSEVDLRFMHEGRVDFHGHVGWLADDPPGLDWLFDIVEPRHGDWNVYAHDRHRLDELAQRCARSDCPLDEMRLAGSPFYLQIRFASGELGISR